MSKASRSAIASVIADKASDNNLASEVAAYLLEANRTAELDSIMRDVINLRADNGVVEVTAVSAHELIPSALSDIEAKVKQLYPGASQVIVDERIDLDQVGGVLLEFPDKQLDLTARAKLNRLKQLTTEK